MKNFKDLYLEHTKMITDSLPEIKHIDLWSEQVSFLMDEYPFKSPAVFFAYRSLNTRDGSNKSQSVKMAVDVYYYYETLADTYKGSRNQNKALSFLDMISKIHQTFHSTSGQNYSEMRRLGFAPIETGTGNLLYVIKFECMISDDSALVIDDSTNVNDIQFSKKTFTEEDYSEIEIN